jgi:hypothetical protein
MGIQGDREISALVAYVLSGSGKLMNQEFLALSVRGVSTEIET